MLAAQIRADAETPRLRHPFRVAAPEAALQIQPMTAGVDLTVSNGVDRMSNDEAIEPGIASAAQSIEMLKAVIDGETYDAVAARFGVTRTAVECRIKRTASQLIKTVGIDGLNDRGVLFARRLRKRRDAVMTALADFEPPRPYGPRQPRVASREEIDLALRRIERRSSRPWRDQALFYLLFATGARPLEIARLEVRDYLLADGSVNRDSTMRAEIAIGGKARPLYFASQKLDRLLALYLEERLEQGLGLGEPGRFRGLDPCSGLFLSSGGDGFKITPYGRPGQRRHLCSEILDTYRKLFRYSGLEGVSALSVRRTVASRLFERGADEGQVGLLLGIGQRSAVRELLARRKPTISELVEDLL
jgi:integrase